ncbi:MAG: phytanoyl-CoA dioxygenase family protein [Rhodospirillales bacterium]|nr:phytanoyl-CoA dioxygenase family protein [Rhodospirillales bacterium]
MSYDLERYQENGIATPIPVIGNAQAADICARVQAFRASGDSRADLALQASPHLLFPWLYALATGSRVLDAVEQILGPDLLIWSSQFFIKDPGDGGFVSWHQDSTYWGLEPLTIASAWIALAPSTPESGCMQVAPGSHNLDQLPHKDTFAPGNLLSRGQEIAVDISGMETLDVVLQPGEMSLHHVALVHGSQANRSTWSRIGFVVRYIPTSVRQLGGRTRATLVRGEDRYNHFQLTEPPVGELTDQSWAIAMDAKARMAAILMQSAAQKSRYASHHLAPATDSEG